MKKDRVVLFKARHECCNVCNCVADCDMEWKNGNEIEMLLHKTSEDDTGITGGICTVVGNTEKWDKAWIKTFTKEQLAEYEKAKSFDTENIISEEE